MNTIWPQALPASRGPKYALVADIIRKSIENKSLEVGAKLPPVRDLAYRLGITPGTVARAYSILTDEGLVQAEVGRGTFVAPPMTPIVDDVWSRMSASAEGEGGDVSLFSPRLVDRGQVALLSEGLTRLAQSDPSTLLNYPTRDGARPLREAVARWLADLPLGPFDAEDVVITHGGQNGIGVIFQTVLTGPRPRILIEELTYAGFRRAGELMRADVQSVEMDEWGMVPEALDHAVRNGGAQIVCLTPEVHNPTGGHMPLERRKALVAVARRHDLQILEDDCYRVGEARVSCFRALAPERAWYVTSISKTLTPALRVGFAIAPQDRAAELRRAAEYGFFGVAQPVAELTRLLLSDARTPGVAARVRQGMAEYVRVAVNVLGRFDLVWDREVPFVWLRLPSGWRSAAFCRAAERAGVQIRSADEFALRDGLAPNAVRIAVNGQVSLDRFQDAMERLRGLLDNPPEQISV
ncbi:transcriptional regulator, GntR family [Cribrihabitans marinus]|uniref:Transcriptional regulator, GntR family n=1 Tax=Cribrihabitans marinus TaxID=1227549 RepID=A0A1H6VX55_9RHOB|nr:PLP-dependent aminotransferase family protein [Cribrihabitans marinus]GGH25575.1 GntR family transcriptional regulator [Cribrihabitans marinus]SEJ05200.1 transcriptional regulator, GntR family [Cribrihabitans marinus]